MNLIEVKAGTLLNSRYRVLCEIQRGGTAIVLRAQDEKDHRLVALKCMSVNTHEAVPMRVVEAEIAFCSSVKSPSFVKLYDLFNHGHMLVIVMELVDGPDLLDLLNSKGGSISEPEALFYVHQLAQAAEIMHQHGFAHRDIKPENSVLILSTHQLKMIDFGLAKHLASARTLGVGTPDYMSPELIPRSKEPSSGSGSTQYDATMVDAWALGVTLYLLTTGRYPFEDQLQKQSQACSVLNILKGNIQPFPAHVSEGTRFLIRQLLKTDPAQRTKLSSFLADPYVLSKALEYAQQVDREDLILGAPSPQEAAVVSTPPKSSPPAAGFLTRLFAIGKKS